MFIVFVTVKFSINIIWPRPPPPLTELVTSPHCHVWNSIYVQCLVYVSHILIFVCCICCHWYVPCMYLQTVNQLEVLIFPWQLLIRCWSWCGLLHHYTVHKPKRRPAAFQPDCLTCLTTALAPWFVCINRYVFIIGFVLCIMVLLTLYAILKLVFVDVSLSSHMCLLKCVSLILFLLPPAAVLLVLILCLPIEVLF